MRLILVVIGRDNNLGRWTTGNSNNGGGVFDEFGEGGEDYLDEMNGGQSQLLRPSSLRSLLGVLTAVVSAILLDCIPIALPLVL
uniref:Uncharacterized protein n=1 Tax=Kalanchoe fedtschenkoi TaxID=63787 RepID=A0A7N0UWB2_KALFE